MVNKRLIFGAYFGILNLLKYFEKKKFLAIKPPFDTEIKTIERESV